MGILRITILTTYVLKENENQYICRVGIYLAMPIATSQHCVKFTHLKSTEMNIRCTIVAGIICKWNLVRWWGVGVRKSAGDDTRRKSSTLPTEAASAATSELHRKLAAKPTSALLYENCLQR